MITDTDLQLEDMLADALAQFAVQSNPHSLSIGIDSTYEAAEAMVLALRSAGALQDEHVRARVKALEQRIAHWERQERRDLETMRRQHEQIRVLEEEKRELSWLLGQCREEAERLEARAARPERGLCGEMSHPLGGPCTYVAGHGGVHSS